MHIWPTKYYRSSNDRKSSTLDISLQMSEPSLRGCLEKTISAANAPGWSIFPIIFVSLFWNGLLKCELEFNDPWLIAVLPFKTQLFGKVQHTAIVV